MNIESDNQCKREETKVGFRETLKSVGNWLAHKDTDEWLKDMRGMLSLVATVITTLTFQSALNPPGGVRSADDSGDFKCSSNNVKVKGVTDPCPGEAVLAVIYPNDYRKFLISNTVCFISSSGICFLLVSGLPLNNRFFTWLFSIAMCITLTSLTFTYMFGALIVTPNPILDSTDHMFKVVLWIWILLLLLVGFFLSLRLFVWVIAKWINHKRKR